MEDIKEKIAAVVVTYNRLELLKECVHALRNQTRKLDEIIIINNDSKDGTKEWLDSQKDLTVIHQANLGGAGGFYTGIKTAYERGYDWIWVMDDDGLPANDSLEALLSFDTDKEVVLNSVVVDKITKEKLAFGLMDYKSKKFYKSLDDFAEQSIIYGAGFFNGTLLPSKIISIVGYPNPDFFIYGDEYDYYLRIIENGIDIITIPQAIIYHPLEEKKYIGKGKFFYEYKYLDALAIKYFPRNIMAIWFLHQNFSFRRLVKTYIYDTFCLVFLQKRFDFAVKYILSILSGITFAKQIRPSKHDFNKTDKTN